MPICNYSQFTQLLTKENKLLIEEQLFPAKIQPSFTIYWIVGFLNPFSTKVTEHNYIMKKLTFYIKYYRWITEKRGYWICLHCALCFKTNFPLQNLFNFWLLCLRVDEILRYNSIKILIMLLIGWDMMLKVTQPKAIYINTFPFGCNPIR